MNKAQYYRQRLISLGYKDATSMPRRAFDPLAASSDDMVKRNVEITQATIFEGKTFAEIGRQHGICGSRARVIAICAAQRIHRPIEQE